MILKKQKYLGYKSKIHGSFDGVTLTETSYYSLQALPKHEHEKHNLVIVLNGIFTENYMGIKHYLDKGDLIVHPKEQIHSNQFAKNASVLNIELSDSWINKYDLNDYIFKKYFTSNQGIITKYIFDFIKTIYTDSIKQDFLVDDFLINIISELQDKDQLITTSSKIPGWLVKVLDILHHVGESEITLENISREVNIHPVYISRVFKDYTGINLWKYYSIQRLKKACKELSYTDKSITEISLECNFYDQAHFVKSFKSNLGFTPLQYRKYIKS